MDYVNVIIDNNTDHTDCLYTYGSELSELYVGDKVIVPFSLGNRLREGYVHSVVAEPDQKIRHLKKIRERDPEVTLPSDAIAVAEFMRNRYFCRYIDAIKCFSPSGKKRKRAVKQKESKSDFETKKQEARPNLTEEQASAVAKISPFLVEQKTGTFLIEGVTNSGKTEIYLRVIEECIRNHRTAIVLVPEISLTPQTIRRFQTRFGEQVVAVLHSKLSEGQRYDEWLRAKNGDVPIVIGARSAVFAPLENIGAIILDEEHESTYQSDMTPKYNTIEVAQQRALQHGAVVILGSATPSMESARKARMGDYHWIRLKKRFNEALLPEVTIVDLREELRNGNKSMFSIALYEAMERALSNKEQIILFLNRRGYSTFLSCRACGFVLRCRDCEISMTYHKSEAAVVCHYCGKKEALPEVCPVCGSKHIKQFGVGTEKVEEAVRELFPGVISDRLDLDTAKKKGSTEEILSQFAKRKTDILIGTQMVAKGLDFSNVGLVGVLSADLTLNLPDFRSAERTFQLVTQSAGRAGRGEKRGKVILQTYSPDHYAVLTAAAQDYDAFYAQEVLLRKNLDYPPFSEIVLLTLAATTPEEAEIAATKVKEALLRKLGKEHARYVLGPRPAPLLKANETYRYHLMMKCLPEYQPLYQQSLQYVKKKVFAEKEKEWQLSIDVNPYGFL